MLHGKVGQEADSAGHKYGSRENSAITLSEKAGFQSFGF
jgi:hypothetical protein